MSKSLGELGGEYEKAIKLVEESVKNTRNLIVEAKKARNYDRVNLLTRELAVFYEELVEMRLIANKLKSYHNPKNGRRVKNDYQQTYYS